MEDDHGRKLLTAMIGGGGPQLFRATRRRGRRPVECPSVATTPSFVEKTRQVQSGLMHGTEKQICADLARGGRRVLVGTSFPPQGFYEGSLSWSGPFDFKNKSFV